MMKIRPASSHDIGTITEIYNDAILTTTAIWNEDPVSIDNRHDWLRQKEETNFPVLVAIDDTTDQVLGYATFGEWRAFSGFRHTAEHSVYVHKSQRGRGVGYALLEALIMEARAAEKHVLVAGIESENAPSIHLHKKFGFVETGHMPQVGLKFGRWLDLTFLQLVL